MKAPNNYEVIVVGTAHLLAHSFVNEISILIPCDVFFCPTIQFSATVRYAVLY